MIPLEMDAAADVRRPGSGDADRLSRGVLARRGRPRPSASSSIYLGFFDLELPPGDSRPRVRQRARPTTCCWRSRSSPSWAPMLERCGLAEDMLDSMGQLFGPVRGGLGYSVIIVGFILGAITGTVAAQVIAMALISMPVMMRYGYNMRYIDRRARGLRHHHPAGAAVAGADRAGRPARQVGRRHVSRRLGPVGAPDRAVRRLHVRPRPDQAELRAAGAEGSAHADRLGAVDASA